MKSTYLLRLPVILAATLVFVVAGTAPAFADHTQQHAEDQAAAQLLITSSSTTTTLAVVGGIILTIVMSGDDSAALEQYLEDNAVAVRHDLSVGAGATVTDLAQAFGVPSRHAGAFGRALRKDRAVLLELADPDGLDQTRTRAFIQRVHHAMLEEPTLVSSVVRFEMASDAG